MDIKELMPDLETSTFIKDYLALYGIEDTEKFINPQGLKLEELEHYDNMEEGCKLIEKYINL